MALDPVGQFVADPAGQQLWVPSPYTKLGALVAGAQDVTAPANNPPANGNAETITELYSGPTSDKQQERIDQGKSSVILTVKTIPGVTATGATINYSIGNIPTCVLELAPGDDPQEALVLPPDAASVLSKLDELKRDSVVYVQMEVATHIGTDSSTKPKNRSIYFEGMLDGLSCSNSVGGTSYQAVLKGDHQVLLEVTTLTPGLYSTSVNVYKSPFYSIILSGQDKSADAVTAFCESKVTQGQDFSNDPIKFYTKLLRGVLNFQATGDYNLFVGGVERFNASKALNKIFEDPRYKNAVKSAVKLFDNIDLSAVKGGYMGQLTASFPTVAEVLKQYFFSGPSIVLENYLNFLNFMGCTLVMSKTKGYVVPLNSFLRRKHKAPELRQLQQEVNTANPADYTSYVYNDNGYRDIGSVVTSGEVFSGGWCAGSMSSEVCFVGEYVEDKKLSNASGVLVVDTHPFIAAYPATAYAPAANTKGKKKFDSEKPIYDGTRPENKGKKEDQKLRDEYKELVKGTLDSYAEQKFLQARYGDRQGSVTMDFNPNWVPGTGGTLYIRSTKMFMDFYVNSVTHKVAMDTPNSGTAVTMITFNCARMGKDPHGVAKDLLLGYDLDKEKAVQKAFLDDIYTK